MKAMYAECHEFWKLNSPAGLDYEAGDSGRCWCSLFHPGFIWSQCWMLWHWFFSLVFLNKNRVSLLKCIWRITMTVISASCTQVQVHATTMRCLYLEEHFQNGEQLLITAKKQDSLSSTLTQWHSSSLQCKLNRMKNSTSDPCKAISWPTWTSGRHRTYKESSLWGSGLGISCHPSNTTASLGHHKKQAYSMHPQGGTWWGRQMWFQHNGERFQLISCFLCAEKHDILEPDLCTNPRGTAISLLILSEIKYGGSERLHHLPKFTPLMAYEDSNPDSTD
jgi:hypothetical protein